MVTRGDGAPEILGRRVPAGREGGGDFTYSVVDAPAPEGAGERRGDRRLRMRLHDGVLSQGSGRAIVDCRICDQSSTGAKLQLHADRALPPSFLLTDNARRIRFRAVLVWQNGREAGVRLEALAPAPAASTAAAPRPFFR